MSTDAATQKRHLLAVAGMVIVAAVVALVWRIYEEDQRRD